MIHFLKILEFSCLFEFFIPFFKLVELDKMKRTKKNIESLEKSKTLAFNPIKFV